MKFNLAQSLNLLWVIGGDFSIVLNGMINSEEKIGGIPITYGNTNDFKAFIEFYDLAQIKFKSSLILG